MKPGNAFLISAILGFFILLTYLALGLGNGLTWFWQALLWLALAGTVVGLVAGLKGRRLLAMTGWGLAGLILVGQEVVSEMSLTESRAKTAEANRLENELLFANALARVPCRNGDTATLQMFNNRGTDRYSLSIRIVPANRASKGYILTSASGEYFPPRDDDIRKYQTEHRTECQSAEYPSLDALMGRLRAHYAAERHKYAK
jgi:hypothetical protein